MIDLEKLRAATAELGYAPATTDEAHLAKLRADNERHDRMNAADPDGKKWRKMAPRRNEEDLRTQYKGYSDSM